MGEAEAEAKGDAAAVCEDEAEAMDDAKAVCEAGAEAKGDAAAVLAADARDKGEAAVEAEFEGEADTKGHAGSGGDQRRERG